MGEEGLRLRQIASEGGQAQRIALAIMGFAAPRPSTANLAEVSTLNHTRSQEPTRRAGGE
jgi:hypothetical protein